MRKIMLAAAILSMAGCATYKNDNKPLYEFPGIQSQIENYYDDNATEDDWVCGAVQMDHRRQQSGQPVTDAGEDGDYLLLHRLRPRSAPSGDNCQGFNTRFFTFDRTADGGLTLASMTGPQH